MFGEYVVDAAGLPPVLRFMPEAVSGIVALYVIFAGTRSRFHLVAQKYWLAFGAMAVIMLCGVINNPSGAGPALSGARYFLRAVPLFFLAAVMPTNEVQLKRQLYLPLGLALLQLPLSIYQRWVIYDAGRYSGDNVRGTLMESGILSMIQICVVLVLTGLLLKGRVGKLVYGVLFLLLLFPTTINETKGTIVLLPIGLMATLFIGSEPHKRMRYLLMGLAALALFGAIFVPVYNRMAVFDPYKKERDISNYFTDKKALSRYMSSGVGGLGTKLDVRRGDAISVTFHYIAKDPVTLAFGLGLGSVSASKFGKNFQGQYYPLFEKFLILSMTYFMLETGIFGLAMIVLLFWLVFLDSIAVAREDDSLFGAVAAGWIGVVALMAVSITYNSYHDFVSVTYLYAYFSGVICARRMMLAHAALERHPVAEKAGLPLTS
jgi:hypothetical protein